jgi:hypothetical protein
MTKPSGRRKPFHATAKKRASGRAAAGDEAQDFVRLIRVLTEEQFDFWVGPLNRAAAAMRADVDEFTRDDRQKTISYWYLLMYLLEIYAATRNPFAVKKGETWESEGLVSMEDLARVRRPLQGGDRAALRHRPQGVWPDHSRRPRLQGQRAPHSTCDPGSHRHHATLDRRLPGR